MVGRYQFLRRGTCLAASFLFVAACGGGSTETIVTEGTTTTTEVVATTSAEASTTTTAAPALFEEGATIALIIPYSAGGGVDIAARVIAPHLEAALREQTGVDVTVVPQNVEGASGRVGVETVSRSEPDGLTIGVLLASPMAGAQVTIGTPFDLRDLTYFGQWEISDRGWVVRKDLELADRTVEALIRRSEQESVLFGQAAGRADLLLLQALLAEEGLVFDAVEIEYEGTSEAALGLLRGDVEALWGHNPVGMKPFVDDNPDDLEFLATTACTRTLSDVPTIVEQGLPRGEEICEAVGGTRRAFYGPPGLPAEYTETYRSALEAVLTDSDVAAELVAAGVTLNYQGGDEVLQGIDNLLTTYESYADVLSEEG